MEDNFQHRIVYIDSCRGIEKMAMPQCALHLMAHSVLVTPTKASRWKHGWTAATKIKTIQLPTEEQQPHKWQHNQNGQASVLEHPDRTGETGPEGQALMSPHMCHIYWEATVNTGMHLRPSCLHSAPRLPGHVVLLQPLPMVPSVPSQLGPRAGM